MLLCLSPEVMARLKTSRSRYFCSFPHLRWLPIQQHVTYKLHVMMHLVNINRGPTYHVTSVAGT